MDKIQKKAKPAVQRLTYGCPEQASLEQTNLPETTTQQTTEGE